MSRQNIEFWYQREREGDKRILSVLKVVDDQWTVTKEIAKAAKLPNNLVLNILHFLSHTRRVSQRMLKTGKFSSYQWRAEKGEM